MDLAWIQTKGEGRLRELNRMVGVLVFGSGELFADTVPAVMYFEGDLKGLREGGRVAFEGVSIGTVTDVGVFIDATRLPVVVEINRDDFRLIGENKLPERGRAMKAMVERKGLRPQLQSESMVTGQRRELRDPVRDRCHL
ncbi:MAG: MlaD family protein [Chromatiales bacterium]